MGEQTGIRWTDSTFNPWWGCTRVSEACQHCYAETLAARFGTGWGKNAERRLFGDKHWNDPVRWNRQARAAGVPRLVFCASMADVFEDHPALPPQREHLWDLVDETPWLTWQLLTKRPENIMGMVPAEWHTAWPVNVWAGTTVETQKRADERIPHLAQVPAPVRFVSCEPLFGPVDLHLTPDHRGHERDYITTDVYPQCLDCSTDDEVVDWSYPTDQAVNWVIAGGESGAKAKPSHPDWFRSLRAQCQAAQVPYLFKQWGEWAPIVDPHMRDVRRGDIVFDHDGSEWPVSMRRVGKKVAGWTLDGQTWDEIPAQPVPTA